MIPFSVQVCYFYLVSLQSLLKLFIFTMDLGHLETHSFLNTLLLSMGLDLIRCYRSILFFIELRIVHFNPF